MNTEIAELRDLSEERSVLSIKKAGQIIRRGGLVVFPTETVYGLGGDGTNPQAAKKIYEAKGRPSDNPLILHFADPMDVRAFTDPPALYDRLAKAFMPGPLTVILPAKDSVPLTVRAGLPTVAVRCPVHPVARALISAAGVPIAAPSANLSGSPSPTCFSDVLEDMQGRVDMLLDGGDCEIGLESTIVKIDSEDRLTLLRPGAVTVEDLKTVAKEVHIASAVLGALQEGEQVLSPGMKYRHYAPHCDFVLLQGSKQARFAYMQAQTKRIGILSYSEEMTDALRLTEKELVVDMGFAEDLTGQAHRLFSALRRLDKAGAEVIFAPVPEIRGMGMALYNRMIRASAHTLIHLQ